MFLKIRVYCSILFIVLICQNVVCQEVIDQTNFNQNVNLTNQGWEQIDTQQYIEAIELFKKAIDLYDGNTDSFTGLATSFFKLKKYDSANFYMEKALSLSPNEADINYLAGNINIREQRFADAIEFYNKALEFNFNSSVKIDLANCYFNRGNAYLFSEKYEDAILDLDKSLNERPFANAYHNRGIAYRHLYKTQEACDNFNAAVQLGSEQSDHYLEQYCKNIIPREILQQADHAVESPDIVTKSDTISVTLYYNHYWELTKEPNSVAYRTIHFRKSDQKFVGPFVDYYSSGIVVVKGQYDLSGNKTGWFERFYENGNLFSKGQYKNNRQFGEWIYYYKNGNIKEKILFNGNHFTIVECFDEAGSKIVDKGTGTWVHNFEVNSNEYYVLIGPVSNGLRNDKWKLKNQNGKLLLTETYEQGMFISGKQGEAGSKSSYEKTQLVSAIFYPPSYRNIERFSFTGGVFRDDYPFFSHLPSNHNPKPMEGVFLNESDTTFMEQMAVVEVQPWPHEGMAAFYKNLGTNMKYPQEARRMRIEGRVFVQFVVDTDGSLTEVRAIKGIGGGCDEEAVRVIKESPNWNPGMQKGRPVKVRMILPITFKLS